MVSTPFEWYLSEMDTTHTASVGDRGRLVLPLALRENQHWEQGTALLFIESDRGVVLTTREQARAIIRDQLSGSSLADELIAQRREAARTEDVA